MLLATQPVNASPSVEFEFGPEWPMVGTNGVEVLETPDLDLA